MRRQSRELALQILFQVEFTPDVSVPELLDLIGANLDKESVAYAQEIVTGVREKKDLLDRKIQSFSSHWKIERMALVDRNLLRMAAFEMLEASEKLKPSIVINEAVEIAKKFGSTESSAFVNGILDQIAKETA